MNVTKDWIISLPNEHLRQRSRRIPVVTEEIKQLIENMKVATLDWESTREHEAGVALAAIQIDQDLRAVIIRNDFENKSDRTFMVFLNPKIVRFDGPMVEDFEGCLSVPDIYGKVNRYNKVKVVAMDLQGHEFRATAEGFLARVFQHEIDHTNGIVFIDH
jgi:peptide deformylase